MESVSEALMRLADGASAEGFPTDARELREVEKRVAELIAADEEYDAAIEHQIKTFDCDYFDPEVGKARKSVEEARKRRAAALLACKGQDHER